MAPEKKVLLNFGIIVLQVCIANSIVVLSKYYFVNSGINPFIILFARHLISFIILMPIILPVLKKTYKNHNFKMSFRRSFINITALTMWTIGYSHISLSIATTFTFLVPVFTIIIAEFYLKEKITKLHKILLLISVIGILTAMRPTIQEWSIYHSITLFATFLWSLSNIVRKLSAKTNNFRTWACYYSIWTVLLTFIFALPSMLKSSFHFVSILHFLPALLLIASLTAFANFLIFYIYKKHEANFVQSFDFLRLIFVSIADITLFNSTLSPYILIGSFLIISSSMLILFKEHKKIKYKKRFIQKIECEDLEVY